MVALPQIGKYAIPAGTAALGGGALGYLAYKLSPERYKKFMGTLGAIVGAAAGGYGGYQLLKAFNTEKPWSGEQCNTGKHVKNFPAPVKAEPETPDRTDPELIQQTVETVFQEGTEARERQQAARDFHASPTRSLSTLMVRPRFEGFRAALNPEDNVLPITNPTYWGYRALGAATDPVINAITGDSFGAEASRSGVRAGGFTAYNALLKTAPKLPGIRNITPGLATLGKASDTATSIINTAKDIGKGLDDRRMLSHVGRSAAEIQEHLPENAAPWQTFLYSVQRQATEKAIQATAAGLSLSPAPTGGAVSAIGVNNAIPLSDTVAVGKEVLRHVRTGERDKAENEGMLTNLGNLTKDLSLPEAWLKAMSMGHGTDKMERGRMEAENRLHARPVDVAATQRNISRMRAEVLRARPDIALGLTAANAETRLTAARKLNRELSKKVQRSTPVTHTAKTLRDRIRQAVGLGKNEILAVKQDGKHIADIRGKTMLSTASRKKYGFDIFR